MGARSAQIGCTPGCWGSWQKCSPSHFQSFVSSPG